MGEPGAESGEARRQLQLSEPRTTPAWAFFSLNLFGLRVYIGSDLVVWGSIGAFVAWQIQDTSAGGLVDWAALYLGAILIAITIHELAHAAVGWAFGLGVRHVFIGIMGGHTMLRVPDPPPAQEFAVLAVGPLSNLLLAGVLFFGFGVSFGDTGFLAVVVWVNAILGLSNFLPLGGLDGAKAVRAIVGLVVPDRLEATRQARFWSALILVLGFGVPAVWLITQGYAAGWALVINAAWFGRGLFQPPPPMDEALAALGGLTAGDVMEPGVICRPTTLLSRIMEQHLVREGASAQRPFVVMSAEGAVYGVISPGTLAEVRTQTVDWTIATAADAMAPVREIPVVLPDAPASTVLVLALDCESDVALVVDEDGELIGCITLGALERVAMERVAA